MGWALLRAFQGAAWAVPKCLGNYVRQSPRRQVRTAECGPCRHILYVPYTSTIYDLKPYGKIANARHDDHDHDDDDDEYRDDKEELKIRVDGAVINPQFGANQHDVPGMVSG